MITIFNLAMPFFGLIVLARQHHNYVERAPNSILISTLLSAFTIPVLIYAIKAGLMP